MNLSNSITISRIVLAPAVLVLVFLHMWIAAIIVLAIALFTDLLDGYAARKLNQETKLGKVLDSVADKVLVGLALFALVWVFGKMSRDFFYLILFFSRDIFNLIVLIFARVKISKAYARPLGKAVTFFQAVTLFWIILQLPFFECWIYGVFVLGIIAGADYLLVFRKKLKKS